jgi:6-phosphogluconolactonase
MARRAFLEAVPIPPGQVHPILCRESPSEGAEQYEALLRSCFGAGPPRFDLVFLGLGENGHTASLFPHTPVLKERKRWAAAVYVAAEDLYRVTLTPVVLNQALMVAFLVAGAAKAGVLQEVRTGAYDPERLPAQLIRPESGELVWLVDQAAAAQLG